jgi:PPOX class probable F420-dependent enzyme
VTQVPSAPKYGDGVNRRGQIQMTGPEIHEFLGERRAMTMCTFNHDGTIHAVAMWYGILDGDLVFETKTKSQKAANLRRDRRITCLVESGESYEELRGIELVGRAEVIDDPARLWDIGVSVFERYVTAPYSDERHHTQVEAMLHKRIGVKVLVDRTVSWDHRKLGVTTERGAR